MSEEYTFRFYRIGMGKRFHTFTFKMKETDLWIGVDHASFRYSLIERVKNTVERCRREIKLYGKKNPDFYTSLSPLPVDPAASHIVKKMLESAKRAHVGPMAAVAGAIAQEVGESLPTEEVIVENGGDIYVRVKKDITVGIFSGKSKIPHFLGIKLKAGETPCGICTSSATVGHSLSLGTADSVTVINEDTTLADALATKYCNEVKWPQDVPQVARIFSEKEKGGIVIIRGKILAVAGKITLTKI